MAFQAYGTRSTPMSRLMESMQISGSQNFAADPKLVNEMGCAETRSWNPNVYYDRYTISQVGVTIVGGGTIGP